MEKKVNILMIILIILVLFIISVISLNLYNNVTSKKIMSKYETNELYIPVEDMLSNAQFDDISLFIYKDKIHKSIWNYNNDDELEEVELLVSDLDGTNIKKIKTPKKLVDDYSTAYMFSYNNKAYYYNLVLDLDTFKTSDNEFCKDNYCIDNEVNYYLNNNYLYIIYKSYKTKKYEIDKYNLNTNELIFKNTVKNNAYCNELIIDSTNGNLFGISSGILYMNGEKLDDVGKYKIFSVNGEYIYLFKDYEILKYNIISHEKTYITTDLNDINNIRTFDDNSYYLNNNNLYYSNNEIYTYDYIEDNFKVFIDNVEELELINNCFENDNYYVFEINQASNRPSSSYPDESRAIIYNKKTGETIIRNKVGYIQIDENKVYIYLKGDVEKYHFETFADELNNNIIDIIDYNNLIKYDSDSIIGEWYVCVSYTSNNISCDSIGFTADGIFFENKRIMDSDTTFTLGKNMLIMKTEYNYDVSKTDTLRIKYSVKNNVLESRGVKYYRTQKEAYENYINYTKYHNFW